MKKTPRRRNLSSNVQNLIVKKRVNRCVVPVQYEIS